MLSFWEKDHFLNYDQIIVGGGIVGLSTAVSIKERTPSQSVLVLEKGIFPSGASTKNAGFACFGSLTEVLADLNTMSATEVLDLVKLRWTGLQLLESRLGADRIDLQKNGGYELLAKDQLGCLAQIDKVNDLLHPLFGEKVYHLRTDKVSSFGFSKTHVAEMIFNPFEGQIHTGKMMKSLQQYAAQLGVEILTGVEVSSLEEKEAYVEVVIKDDFRFTSRQVALCTNAFSKQFIKELPLAPGRGMVLVTESIKDLPFKGTFHYDEGYYYFRNYQDRVVFGGGRNLAKDEEETTSFGINEAILAKLKSDLSEIILPGHDVKIEHIWSGIMAFGENKQPIMQKYSDRLFMGLRLGGMGVAVGSKMGDNLAEMMLASE
jgi:gamma-glutamylputrescine oxidase